jgi:hypothetical protein
VNELPATKSEKPVYLKLLRFLFYTGILGLIIVISLISMLFIYEDEVKSAVIKELNRHLNAEVKLNPKDIDLTIIRTFPDCSIEFKNVLMMEALPVKKRDTLIYASRLNLHFNIRDLWNKNYTIRKIRLDKAVFKPVILKDGRTNYIFWKNTQNSDNDSLSFRLEDITIRNSKITYIDKQNKFKTVTTIKNLNFSGAFGSVAYDMSSEGELLINEIVAGGNSMMKNKLMKFNTSLLVSENVYSLKKASLLLNKMDLELSGNFKYKDSLQAMNLKFNAPEVDIASLLSLLPNEYKERTNEYESSGNFFVSGIIKYSGSNGYSINSKLGINNGTITYKTNGTSLREVNLNGSFKYSDKLTQLHLNNFSLRLKNDTIKGNCDILDFKNPFVKFSANAAIDLKDLLDFWPIDTITSLNGRMKLLADVEGFFHDMKGRSFSEKVKAKLSASVNNLEARFKHDNKIYAVQSVYVSAIDGEFSVRDLKLRRGKSDMLIQGKIPGFIAYLFNTNSPLTITGNLSSEYLSLDDFIADSESSATTNDAPLLPKDVTFSFDAKIDKFSFGKFNATNIRGDLEMKSQKAFANDVKFETMEGFATINAFADNSKNKLNLTLQAEVQSINIARLFSEMNNFGQETLKDDNLKGVASASIDFSGQWSNSLVSDPGAIKTKSEIVIERGELNDFKPLLSLSKFIDINELKRIRFQKLQGNINIENSIISIPKTTIKNSALNIELSGTHTFNNEIDYHIRLLLSELLAKKSRKNDEEFGPIEKDQENTRSLYLLMTGTVDKPVIKYDRQGLKNKVRTDIKQEKQNMKALLKEEFGFFKKDTSTQRSKKESQEFTLDEPQRNPPKKTLQLKKKEEDEDF